MPGLRASARSISSRCRCPPDSPPPPSADRLQPHRHRPDVAFEAAGAERFPDLVGVEPGRAGDVVADAVGRHLTVLQNDGQMTADRLGIEVEEIVAVEQHRPRVRPLEAEQQPVDGRCLARDQEQPGHREQHRGSERREQAVEGELGRRPAARPQRRAPLAGEEPGPAREDVRLGVGDAELGEAREHRAGRRRPPPAMRELERI